MLNRLTRPSLKGVFLSLTALVMAVALAVSVALIVMTSRIHASTASLAAAVESVYLAEEIEIELLLNDPAAIRRRGPDGDSRLRDSLSRASEFVTTDEEEVVLRTATARVDAYVAAAREPGRLDADVLRLRDAAVDAVEKLIDVNLRQSEKAVARAERLDKLADVGGYGASGLLLLVTVLLLWWLRTQTFRPLREVARAMEAYGRGDRSMRAREAGPRELREIASQFNRMAAALDDRRSAQTAFLGGVAHDLRNPLAALRMAASALERGGNCSAGRERRMLDVIGRQLGHLERMVGDFLDISRIEAGRLELRLEPQDLRPLVDRAAALFKSASPRHPIAVHLPPEAVLVQCDPLRVEQVLVNLISNAIKYSPDGGEVTLTAANAREGAIVSVRDRGVGLSEAERHRLFEPFSRVGLSQEAIPGAGLGLYVVRRIVQAHGGRVEVDSEPGSGSTFRVVLPAPTA